MVSHCANPKCVKPLLYLREGRIFIFEMPVQPASETTPGRGAHRLEHFWLCGDCSRTMLLHQSGDGVLELLPRLAPKQARRTMETERVDITTSVLAS